MHKYCLLLGKRAFDAHNQLSKGENDDNYTTNKYKCADRGSYCGDVVCTNTQITPFFVYTQKNYNNLISTHSKNSTDKEQRNEFNV